MISEDCPNAEYCDLKTNVCKNVHIFFSFFLGNGYITTETLAEILREIDGSLNDYEVEQIVEEVDEDASGTVDFDEFMAMMTGE